MNIAVRAFLNSLLSSKPPKRLEVELEFYKMLVKEVPFQYLGPNYWHKLSERLEILDVIVVPRREPNG